MGTGPAAHTGGEVSDGEIFVRENVGRGKLRHTSNFGVGPSDAGHPPFWVLVANRLCGLWWAHNLNDTNSSEIKKRDQDEQTRQTDRLPTTAQQYRATAARAHAQGAGRYPPPPSCISYAKVPNQCGPYAYCSLDKAVDARVYKERIAWGAGARKGNIMHKYPQTQSCVGSSGQTLTTNVSMTLCNWQICHQTHVLCGRSTFVLNQMRYQSNTVPTPAVAWTRASLIQRGGTQNCAKKMRGRILGTKLRSEISPLNLSPYAPPPTKLEGQRGAGALRLPADTPRPFAATCAYAPVPMRSHPPAQGRRGTGWGGGGDGGRRRDTQTATWSPASQTECRNVSTAFRGRRGAGPLGATEAPWWSVCRRRHHRGRRAWKE